MSALTNSPYNQNFDTLANTGTSTTLPTDWFIAETGTNAEGTYAAGTGSSNTGNTYSFGATGSTERALGGLQSGSLVPTIGAKFENATGGTLSSVLINYVGEQWRLGTTPRSTADRLDFQYSVDATSLTTGTWTDFNALDFIAPITSGTVGLLDGNAAANRTAISATLNGLTLGNGGTLWLRWNSFDASGADDGLAIDDFSISAPVGKMEITEYLYDGADKEFIEFTNVGSAPVDMTGWSYDDDSRAPGTVNLSAFGTVAPGESVILAETTAAAFRSAWGLSAATKVIGGLTTNLGRADEINLFDNTNALVDRLTYGDQTYSGTVRAQGSSAWAPANQLTEQTIDGDWRLSTVGDLQNSWLSTGGDKGNPGSYSQTLPPPPPPPPPAQPSVNLSVSANGASEAAASSITVTVTATAAVSSAQSVALNVSGTVITASDYYLSKSTLTIAAGQTSASATFIVSDDATVEGSETAVLSIASPTSGIVLGTTTTQNITIANNDGSLLTKVGGAASANGAEISAFDPGSDRLFVVAGLVVEIYNVSASGSLSLAGTLAPGFTAPVGTNVLPNSVAVHNGVVAVAYAVVNASDNSQQLGHVSFYSAGSGAVLNDVQVGYLPDMVTFTPDGSKVLTANEGEPNSYNQANSFDPVGSISIIDLSGGVASASVQEAGFTAFNSQMASLKAQGVRLFGPNASVAQDLEPEYVAISPDGTTAFVTLQEANALAKVDIATATVTSIVPLGTKDFSVAGNGFDASDRDPNGASTINIQTWPVLGMYQPDTIARFTVGGQTYYLTANEGDSRDYTGFGEEVRVSSASYVLDPTLFPNAATLKQDANLGRLQLTGVSGDTDNDGDIDQIMAFGARSFSIWDSNGNQVYDSGDDLEQITAARTPTLFNSDGLAASFDSRSDNKGPEPEGAVIGNVGGKPYAFVGLERTGDIVVFDVSNPTAPQFVQYINTPEDVAPEGLTFISAADSPTGKPLLVSTNEVSKTIAVFQIQEPVRIADIQGRSHTSPLAGQGVKDVAGKVTAITSNGFWIQDPQPDGDAATSDAIFVFTTNAAILGARSLGEAVKVSGTVSEFRPGGDADNLTVTEITSGAPQALSVSAWTDAPVGAIAPLVLGVDRIAPTAIINNDGSVNVETGGDYEPTTDGIDFYESLEGMLIQVNNPVAISPTNSFDEIWVLPNNGAGATGLTARGGIGISAGDFNPERLQLDNLLGSQNFPTVDVGARLQSVTGVLDYSFNNYELRTLTTPVVAQASGLQKEVTTLTKSATDLTVATFNVENLDPGDGAAKFNSLATAIVTNLQAPDILNLEEVQDNNGATNNGVVDASQTLQTLITAISAAGGPTYQYAQLDPSNNQDGGEPGGNIRVAFLYNPARVSLVPGSLQRLTDTNLGDGDAFASSRKPLVGTFTFNGEQVTVIGNHFNSKGGDDPLFGPTQPPVLSSELQRAAQADIVADYVEGLLSSNAHRYVVVAGDLNDFEFSAPLTRLEGAGLTSLIETLPTNERYTYNFEGNAQALDHLQASGGLVTNLSGFDVVHINSEFATQVSDHDPVLARFTIHAPQTLNGTSARNVLTGGNGNDTLAGLQGRDQLTGGAGFDKFVYTSVLDAGDVITDFVVGVDSLVIDTLLASVGYTGGNAVAAGYLGISAASGKTIVSFDSDGSAGTGAARVLVELLGVTGLASADLLL